MQTKKKVAWILAAVALGAVVGYFIYRRTTQSLEQDAREMLATFISMDGRKFYEYSLPHERELLGLTPEKVQMVFDRLIKPRFAGYKAVGPIESIQQNPNQAIAWVLLRDDAGHEIEVNVAPWATPDGGRDRIMNVLDQARMAEYCASRGLKQTTDNVYRARLEGIAKDKPFLESLNIMGRRLDGPQG